MTKFSERLKHLRDKLGISQAQMASELGLSGGNYVSQLEKDRKEPSPMLELLLEKLEREKLGSGSPEIDKKSPAFAEDAVHYQPNRVRWISVLPWDLKAPTIDEIRSRAVDLALGKIAIEIPDADAFALTLKGDEMAPEYREGAKLIVSPAAEREDGSLVVAKRHSGGTLFRRFQYLNDDRFRLVAYNTIYPPTEHTVTEFDWIYVVIAVQIDTRR